jgi:DUF4097 and DUF4098 domain-containing protein YvlB
MLYEAIHQNPACCSSYRYCCVLSGYLLISEYTANSKCNLTLTTQNGNVIKSQLNDISVVARCGNGNIDIKDGAANMILGQTGNGNINVALTQRIRFTVNALTGNGDVTKQGIDMATTVENPSHIVGVTSAGAGNLKMTLSAGNGNIALTYFNP